MKLHVRVVYLFFFNDTATTEIYTLSLHDALPISRWPPRRSLTRNERSTLTGSPTARSSAFRSARSEEHTSELQSHLNLVCRLLLEKKKRPRTNWPKTQFADCCSIARVATPNKDDH